MRTIFAIPGLIMSIISMFIMILAMVPFLGWLNWINIPLVVVALLFSLVSRLRSGVILCLVILVLSVLRLKLGGGVI